MVVIASILAHLRPSWKRKVGPFHYPSLGQPDIRNVDAPNVVRVLGSDIPEEIGIDLVFQSPFTEIGTGMNSFNSHFPHGCLNTLSSHDESVPFENSHDAATAEERPAGVYLVNPVPKKNLFRRWKDRTVIKPGTGHAQKRGLGGEGEFRTVRVDQLFAVSMAQAIPDFFFNQAS